MRKRSNQREVYIRRQAVLLIFIALVIILLIGLVQSVYELTPAGHMVMAEQENSTISQTALTDHQSSYALAIWQGSKGKPFTIEAQGASTEAKQAVVRQRYTGIGKMLYCLQLNIETSDMSTGEIEKLCQQQREQDVQQQVDQGNETEDNDKVVIEPTYEGQVFLTFDDGPSKITSAVLDVLAEHNIEATFFVLGEKVDLYPQLTKRIVEEGHSIGNHSYNHRYDELYKSPQGFIDQVIKTTKSIYKSTGIVTPLFRAPGGSYSNLDKSYMKALDEAGYLIFDWNVDSGDSRSKEVTAEEIVANVKQSKLRDRIVVLMHDSSIHQATLDALPEIIAYYQEQNYQFVKISSTTEPVTSPLAPSIKWKRVALTEKQALRLKTETDQLIAQAKEDEGELKLAKE